MLEDLARGGPVVDVGPDAGLQDGTELDTDGGVRQVATQAVSEDVTAARLAQELLERVDELLERAGFGAGGTDASGGRSCGGQPVDDRLACRSAASKDCEWVLRSRWPACGA